MAHSHKLQLVKIDEQIINLEYLYERELLREAELNKRTLLLSRGFKYRLDNLYKARTALIKASGVYSSTQMTYAVVLAERKEALEQEEHELVILKQKQHDAGVAAMLAGQNQDTLMVNYNLGEISILSKEIIRQEAQVRNKKRAYENWIKKAGKIEMKERRIPSKQEAEEIAYDVLETEDKKKRYEDYIKSLPIKPVNNASLELLANPADIPAQDEEIVEENPFLLTEKHKPIIIGE